MAARKPKSDSAPAPAPPKAAAAAIEHLFRRRWTVPVLAQLQREGGSRFVTLAYRLNANEGAVRSSLDHLIESGLVAPNPGYGHPLRPEYVLTPRGQRAGACCLRLDDALARLDLRSLALRKWAMPVLWAVGEGPARFTAVARSLNSATDRVVASALKELCDSHLLNRRVYDAFPPTTLYVPTTSGRCLIPILSDL